MASRPSEELNERSESPESSTPPEIPPKIGEETKPKLKVVIVAPSPPPDGEAIDAGKTDALTIGTASAMIMSATASSLDKKKQDRLNLDEAVKSQDEQAVGIFSSGVNQLVYEVQSYKEYLKDTLTSEASNVLFKDPNSEQLTRTGDLVLKTHFDLKSFSEDEENESSMKYIQQLFLKAENFAEQLSKREAEANKEREIAVKCELIKGRGLPANDPDGTSDPYCKIVVLNKRFYNEKIVQKGNIDHWVESALVMKECVALSTVQPSTLDPDWDKEVYELALTNPEEEYLVIEVWDSSIDDHKKKITGLKGFARFFASGHGDDFLGRAFYLLEGLSTREEKKVLKLYSHSMKHERGEITLKLKIVERGESIYSEDKKSKEYAEILQIVIAKEAKKDDEFIYKWNGRLSENAKKLLSQQVSMKSLPKLRVAAIHFSVSLEYHKSYGISMEAVQEAMDGILGYEIELSQHRAAMPPPNWVMRLLQEIRELYNSIVDTMKGHLNRFDFKSQSDISEFKGHILLLKSIFSCQTFRSELEEQEEGFSHIIISSIQTAVPDWVNGVRVRLTPSNSESELDKVSVFKSVCHYCIEKCHQIIDGVQPVFNGIGIDYFSPFFYSLDTLLYPEVKSTLELCSTNAQSQMLTYEIFQILYQLKPLTLKVNEGFLATQKPSVLRIVGYHQWFNDQVTVWINLAQSKARELLKHAIEQDTAASKLEEASHSSSVIVAHGILLKIIQFWQTLDWPDKEQSIVYFGTLLQSMGDLAMYYCDIITQSIDSDEAATGKEKPIVTDKLCMCLNNIHHIKMAVREIGEGLDTSSYYMFLDKGSSDHTHSQRAEDIKRKILTSVDEDITEKRNFVVRKIHKVVVSTVEIIMAAVILEGADVASEKAIEPFLGYIADNLAKLAEALVTPNFLIVLEDLWVALLKIITDEYGSLPHKASSTVRFCRLKDILVILLDYFNIRGNGLTKEHMETESYTRAVQEIAMSTIPTEKLIKDFLTNLIQQQYEASSSQLGELKISHYYNPSKKALKLMIQSAQGIPAHDKAGKSSTYAVVHLLPAEVYPKAFDKGHKTGIRKRTLHPVFNEKIRISVPAARLTEEGSVILLGLFHHEKFGKDVFIGASVLPTSKTPLGQEPKMEQLKLFRNKNTIPAYSEIEKRITETVAHNFIKMLKKFTSQETEPET